MGYNVIGVSHSANDLINKAKNLLPDLILTDISLPGDISGIEAIRIIKAWKNIPFIYISGLKDDNTYREALETEPCAFLTKPYNFIELKNQIDNCIKIFESKDQNVRQSIE
jgi:DNA-binding response OmpR family regulator